MSITRRLFLCNTAAAGATVTVGSAAVAEPAKPLTPDERIEAAIEEIKAAYGEKWPDAPIHIRDFDNLVSGMVIILTHVDNQPAGTIKHERVGAGWRAKGVAA